MTTIQVARTKQSLNSLNKLNRNKKLKLSVKHVSKKKKQNDKLVNRKKRQTKWKN